MRSKDANPAQFRVPGSKDGVLRRSNADAALTYMIPMVHQGDAAVGICVAGANIASEGAGPIRGASGSACCRSFARRYLGGKSDCARAGAH